MPCKLVRALSLGVIATALAGSSISVAKAADNYRYEWRWPGWRQELNPRPSVDYTAPPVVYREPNYDQQPVAAPVVNIPLFYR